jgi:16S rRNA (cytidine1402-2'-O)-methyltransferase
VVRLERGANPLHPVLFHADHVKPARRQLVQAHQVVAGRKHNAPLFDVAHAGCRAAVAGCAALSDFNKHGGAIGIVHDQVNLAAAAPRRSIIAHDERESRVLQKAQRQRLGCITGLLGRRCRHRRLRGLTFGEHVLSSALASSYASALVAAHDAAASQHYPHGALYVVATPIGNLADISLRALHVLMLAETIACEDTRHTQALLRAYGIDKTAQQLMAVHQHNEAQAAQGVMEKLQQGQRVAYVSDAGTPAVSDPGARLVSAVRSGGCRVVPLPGASSVTTALSVAGIGSGGTESTGFVFAGFLAAKATERAQAVQALAQEPRSVILLEAPHRIEALAQALAALGARPVTIGRELTKQFEEITTLACQDFPAWLAGHPNRQRGEFALVLHPAPAPAQAEVGADLRILGLLLAELPLKTAVKLAVEITGQPRNVLYEAALAIKAESSRPAD